jgi:malate dehydrogenase
MRDWVLGNSDIVSMGITSDGSYDIPEGLMFSYPCRVTGDGKYTIVKNLPVDDFSR